MKKRITIQFDPKLMTWVKEQAEKAGRSISNMIEWWVKEKKNNKEK